MSTIQQGVSMIPYCLWGGEKRKFKIQFIHGIFGLFMARCYEKCLKTQLQKKSRNPMSFIRFFLQEFYYERWQFTRPCFKRFWCWAVCLLFGSKPKLYFTYRPQNKYVHFTYLYHYADFFCQVIIKQRDFYPQQNQIPLFFPNLANL